MDFLVYALFILAAMFIAAELNGTPAPIASPEPAPQPKPAIAAPIQAPARVVVSHSPADDLGTLSSAELRRRCQAAGVKWRNAHGKGKHLRKGEMVQALSR